MKKNEEKDFCPRCGDVVSYYEHRKVGNNEYVYAVHSHQEGGKRTVRKCYLGPSSSYIYTTQFNSEIMIIRSLLADKNAVLKYITELTKYIQSKPELTNGEKNVLKTLHDVIEQKLADILT